MLSKQRFFLERSEYFNQQIERLQNQYNTYSIYRIITFIVFLVLLVWSVETRQVGLLVPLALVFFFTFGLLVKRHNQISKSKDLNQKLANINAEEAQRINLQFENIDGGDEFLNDKHPYTGDLDIFGKNSLFQLINRTETFQGRVLFKSWLERASGKGDIKTRQQVIKEVTPLVDWRQKIQAYGKSGIIDKTYEQDFSLWLKGDDLIRNNLFYRLIPYIVILFLLSLIIGVLYANLPVSVLGLSFIVTGYFLYRIKDYSNTTYAMTQSAVLTLTAIESMLFLIENQKFHHKYLIQLQGHLRSRNSASSERIKELRKILDLLNLRGNKIYLLLNVIFLLDFILLSKAEKWRWHNKNEVPGWFDVVAEFEALNSIGAYAFAHENYVFPSIEDENLFIRCRNMGHPLIPTDTRVNNNFSLGGRGSICIVTGSNMAGKSTFLRTVGINTVLAFCGAPVCADSFEVSCFQVFASMRTKDNLEENISSFYAELIRLKMLLEQISEENPVFFLLDEILKGTNSEDRHIGAESLILQLNKANAFGLVSTHDLELGKLNKLNNQIINCNFSSSIEGEEIIFDYKLRAGICKSTNASRLMAKMGIRIKS